MIKISVIIPIYNMEEYLPQCLDSIVSQTLREIEILCIDDGSTDGSEEVLKLYCNRDSRIRVIKQNNQGVSCARNLGIEEASGKYVIFMDPDDWYPDKEILETLYVGAEKNNVSIAGGSFMDYHDGIYNEKFPDRYFGYHFEKDGVIEYTDYQFDFGYQRFIFEKSLLTENHISFKKYVRYQDPPFFVEAMIAARRFYGVDKPAYCYRYGHTEIKWNRQKVCDLLKGISDNLQISSKYGLKKLHNLTIRRLNDEYRQLLGDSIFFEEYACDVFEEMLKTMNYIDANMLDENNRDIYKVYNPIIMQIKEDIKNHVNWIDNLKGEIEDLKNQIKDRDEQLRVKEEEKRELEGRVQEVYDSFSYKAGHAITVLLRLLARIVKGR